MFPAGGRPGGGRESFVTGLFLRSETPSDAELRSDPTRPFDPPLWRRHGCDAPLPTVSSALVIYGIERERRAIPL